MADGDGSVKSLDLLPSAVLATIMTKLDLPSICSLASTCRIFHSCASQILNFLPTFHLLEISPTVEFLRPLLPPNPFLRSLKVDCGQLDDSAIQLLLKPSLHELCLHNCADFSGKLLSEIGGCCKDLRSLYLSSVAEKRGRAIHIEDLEELLSGCTQLEALTLMFDVSFFLRQNFARVWAMASEKLSSLEIGCIYSVTVTELLSQNLGAGNSMNRIVPSMWPNIEKLCLSVDYITDAMVGAISKGLISLTHLELQDAPIIEPRFSFDLTNVGLQQINQLSKLRHLSLVRSQEFLVTYFRRVNDLGILLMADGCADLESICLGGFCRVTDTGFRTILHTFSNLNKLRVFHGIQLTHLVFHDISATSLSLKHVSLRWCSLLTNDAVKNLSLNKDLSYLDLRDCRSLRDEALRAIGTIPKLKTLLLDGSDISDAGLSHLRPLIMSSLVSLSVRGCKKLTDKSITVLFDGLSKIELHVLDLSNLPYLSDAAILQLTRSKFAISELRLRQCPLIGDVSVMALASMQVNEDQRHGSSLRLLDLYNCGGLTQLSFKWLKNPYFPRMRWLGVTGSLHRDLVDALARSRPFLHVACHGEELGADHWDSSDSFYMHHYDEVDEFEQWLFDGEDDDDDDDDIADDENDAELLL
ncbi:F-box/LRR-repeat protein 10 isoform X2 [Cucumis melo var. makuwa]|uniref:F-box/LRR-repeat protein 10 isoform X2 n=1 Tax=Cucumis melo var. makuwa TaxID=1194695 RepID=A0A5A7TE11_CUCMM|nr:F-box/LRR-repeat protein 10 isoform X2 [Cucumis melo var. makuwa]TYK23379.1 F-box/LRR-repeat protein 10 isoform X2 [Cucumis melo var. makuwa]